MDLQLGDKVAVIAGGSRGIGLAVARVLAEEGAGIVLLSRNEGEASAAAAALASEFGTRAIGVGADTTDDAAVARMADAVSAFGGATILVNCAAAPAGQAAVPPASETAWDHMATHMNTKVMGYLRCARALLPSMRAAGWGRIVNVSGLGARRTGDLVGTIRNVAVTALSKNLADELAGTGITVTTVHPGLTRTEKVDAMLTARAEREGKTFDQIEEAAAAAVLIGRVPTADEVADVIAFLCSPRSVAINGDVVTVGGGTKGPIVY